MKFVVVVVAPATRTVETRFIAASYVLVTVAATVWEPGVAHSSAGLATPSLTTWVRYKLSRM